MHTVRIDCDGVGLDVRVDGPDGGPPVLLLHGFPESWYGWHRQVAPLAAAGCRVLVPDQRGYGTSDKPRGAAAYGLDRLAADAATVARLGAGRPVHLVGHDWGGLVAWWTAVAHTDWVASLTILNAPHPQAFRRYLAQHASQRRRSRYIAFFQLPWLPEALLGAGRCRRLRETLLRTSAPGTFTAADLARYLEAWQRPGALTAMLDWYRGLRRAPAASRSDARVRARTRVLWGTRDRFLEAGLADASLALCERGDARLFAGASHWLQHERPGEVVEEILWQVRVAPGG
jgi:pimeloyl-ACP methyl ester carboxylesterase